MKTHRWADIKRERLEAAGWTVATAKEFLGLNDDENAVVEQHLALRALAREYIQSEWARIDQRISGKPYDHRIEERRMVAWCELRDAVFSAEELEQIADEANADDDEVDGERWAWGERPADGTPPSRDEGQSKRFNTVEELIADLNADDGEIDAPGLYTVRAALADLPGVMSVDWVTGDAAYHVSIKQYSPDITRAIAKRLAGMGVYYHVVPGSATTERT